MHSQTLMIGLIVVFLSAQSFAKKKEAPPNCDVLPKPQNVITLPSYTMENDCLETVEPEAKLQYKAESKGDPFFHEKESQSIVESGALYKEGSELYVEPDPDFTKTDEVIPEENEEILLAK